jgi:hypothetical protein
MNQNTTAMVVTIMKQATITHFPNGFGLGLDAGDCIDDSHSTIEDTQRALNL